MSLPTLKQVTGNEQYYKDKGKILALMGSGRPNIDVNEPICAKVMEEIRDAKWTIVRKGENFEGGFIMVGQK
jgi:hypothetical protein